MSNSSVKSNKLDIYNKSGNRVMIVYLKTNQDGFVTLVGLDKYNCEWNILSINAHGIDIIGDICHSTGWSVDSTGHMLSYRI